MGTKTKKTEEINWAKIEATLDRATALSEENEKKLGRLEDAIFGVDRELKGISGSNGMVAEDYFFESLSKTRTLGGVHYDLILRNMKNGIKLEDGKTLDDEYDTVMINDTAVCVVEVKYKVERHDINRLAKKRVHNFKKLFPMYADCKIYLAFGGLTFLTGAIDAAKELGMGVLRLKGDAVEIYDKGLKAY